VSVPIADEPAQQPAPVWLAQNALPPLTLFVAVVLGAISTGDLRGAPGDLRTLGLALLAALAWWVIWRVAAGVNWAEAFASWRTWQTGAPLAALPYTEPGSPSAQMSATLGQFRHWAQHALLPAHGAALLAAFAALAVALALSAALGRAAFGLTILVLIVTQVAIALSRASGRAPALLQHATTAVLPFALGFAAFQGLNAPVAGFLLLAMLTALPINWLRNVCFAALVALLFALRHTVGGFAAAILWLPSLVLPDFRLTAWWTLALMTVGALAMG
jgi:hypothetical protein